MAHNRKMDCLCCRVDIAYQQSLLVYISNKCYSNYNPICKDRVRLTSYCSNSFSQSWWFFKCFKFPQYVATLKSTDSSMTLACFQIEGQSKELTDYDNDIRELQIKE